MDVDFSVFEFVGYIVMTTFGLVLCCWRGACWWEWVQRRIPWGLALYILTWCSFMLLRDSRLCFVFILNIDQKCTVTSSTCSPREIDPAFVIGSGSSVCSMQLCHLIQKCFWKTGPSCTVSNSSYLSYSRKRVADGSDIEREPDSSSPPNDEPPCPLFDPFEPLLFSLSAMELLLRSSGLPSIEG